MLVYHSFYIHHEKSKFVYPNNKLLPFSMKSINPLQKDPPITE